MSQTPWGSLSGRRTVKGWTKRLCGFGTAILLVAVMTASAQDVQRVVLKVEGML
jgi:hypothetical protein